MFAHRLQRLRLEKRVTAAVRQLIATHEVFKFAVADFLLRRRLDNAARTDVIKIIQQLRRVRRRFVAQIERVHRRLRLLRESDIIKIGGFDDRQLRLGIDKSPQLMLGKSASLLADSLQMAFRPLAIVIKQLVFRLTLTQSHPLHIGDEPFNQIIGRNAVQLPFRTVVVHLRNAHESQMIHRLSPSVGVVGRGFVGAFRIDSGGIERTIVIGVCQIVQLVCRIVVFRRAS